MFKMHGFMLKARFSFSAWCGVAEIPAFAESPEVRGAAAMFTAAAAAD